MSIKLLLEKMMNKQGLLMYTELWKESLADALQSWSLNLKDASGSSFAANTPWFKRQGN